VSRSGPVRACFQEPIGAGDPHFIAETARHYRPLAVLSFASTKLWGLDVPAGWQLTNLLSLGVTLGVYALAARRVGALGSSSGRGIFTLHPAIVGTNRLSPVATTTLSRCFCCSAGLLLKGHRVLPAFCSCFHSVEGDQPRTLAIVPLPLGAVDCK